MPAQTLFAFVLLVAMFNGIFSPYFIVAKALAPFWFPYSLTDSAAMLNYLSNLVVATFTLLIGGVPAALYERLWEGERRTAIGMWIWLGSVLFLSIPGFENAAHVLGRVPAPS